ncbi:merozoite surface protein 2 [Plasmodium reichenowi]|uniref:Merozoite surface antigen 2 n=1 Tax=Plasmodium reichenowi TaxID=5854 RepID=A0A151LUX2_PLARE|nr:merozoite surface protein 2 [Plasmodium reichenowi]KYO02986.1 merozoite surface protein 2 [Plasmodium reichenowi]
MKVIKTLSIINFFIFLAFNIKNESKYSNTLINNAYNMSIRRSMTDTGSSATSGGATSGASTPAAAPGTAGTAGTAAAPGTAGTAGTAAAPAAPADGDSTTVTNAAGANADGNPSTVATTTTTNNATESTSNSSEESNADNAAKNTKDNEANQEPNKPNEETQNNSNVQPPEVAEAESPTSQPEQAKNPTPATEQAETPELQSVPENKATEKHGHMHGSRNNHPQNTSESQKECTDGDQTNCGAQTSLLSNSSNIASINKFVALISATLVLAFAIFI